LKSNREKDILFNVIKQKLKKNEFNIQYGSRLLKKKKANLKIDMVEGY